MYFLQPYGRVSYSCARLASPSIHPAQVADFGAMGPVRCQACKAYVNPYMRWTDGGRTMQCCFCGANTEASVGVQSGCTVHDELPPTGCREDAF